LINVILVANVKPIKRIEDLVIAASKLNDGKRRIQYYIVGDFENKSYYDTLKFLIKDHQLEADFFFLGHISTPHIALNRFDIGVLTSSSEGFSNSIMEYLNAVLPVVASKVGGNPELVFHGYNGFLYEVGNIDELTEFLRRLACDNGLRQALAANAKKSMKKFDYRTMIEHHEKVYIAK
jgi:glycosyltransferase involved in cell wall biosynthesis